MNHLRWTRLALADLQSISEYIESRSTLTSANTVCRAIYDSVQLLRSFPERGNVGLEDGTRELVIAAFPAYIVVYRLVAQDHVDILRIWHGAQQRGQ